MDAYWTPDGKRVNEAASWDPNTSWNKTYPLHVEPRIVAAPVANDIMKCQLKPVDVKEYKVKFSKSQEGALEEDLQGRRARLEQAERRLRVHQGDVPEVLIA